MTKFIDVIRKYKCLYAANDPATPEEVQKCWKLAARELKYRVERCQQMFEARIAEYKKHLEGKETNLPMELLNEMEFMREELKDGLEADDSVVSLKMESQSTGDCDPQQPAQSIMAPGPSRTRRNAVDESCKAEILQNIQQEASVPYQCQPPATGILPESEKFFLRYVRTVLRKLPLQTRCDVQGYIHRYLMEIEAKNLLQ
ncbi:uncharacterized protein LOC121594765 [Anopheles merus]|uniref:MADF domain-containing protein n=1 Tax=Anopheles merus TaxID=30066 RepID=A0A182UVC8_ANOME|nr:uncharacterized protein LOC121594765 [Anopheles merus]